MSKSKAEGTVKYAIYFPSGKVFIGEGDQPVPTFDEAKAYTKEDAEEMKAEGHEFILIPTGFA